MPLKQVPVMKTSHFSDLKAALVGLNLMKVEPIAITVIIFVD